VEEEAGAAESIVLEVAAERMVVEKAVVAWA
jgi:hypothetical protein